MEPGTEIATRDDYLAVVDEEQELQVGDDQPGDGRVGGIAGPTGAGVEVGDGNPGGLPGVAEPACPPRTLDSCG